MKITDFKLEHFFRKYEFAVECLLCCSDCESFSVEELFSLEDNAFLRFQRFHLGYTQTQGGLALRSEISRIYQSVSPEQILVHSGAEEAIFLFMHAVLDADDHIIVQSPCYQSLFEPARSIGCKVSFWQAREDKGWSLDLDELCDRIQSNTKVIVINTPHNPTGYHMSCPEYEDLNRIVREKNIVLFSDEVYRESEYSVDDRLPAACDLNEKSVSLGVMSKTYGLAGLRIGWIATQNSKILKKMQSLKDYTTICNSAPSEFLAELALRHREKIVNRNIGIIKTNLNILDDFFQGHEDRFYWQKPKAGPIAFPRWLGGDIDRFCNALVQKAGVLLLPGTVYGDEGNHFRIGFGRENLQKAIDRLNAFLQQL